MKKGLANNGQCLYCGGCFILKEKGERLSWCLTHGEIMKDVNFMTGLSPALQGHGLEGRPCWRFEAGRNKNVLEDWSIMKINI